jgi:N-acetylglucosamine-6-phosphate deacetylase
MKAFRAARLLTSNGVLDHPWLLVEDGRIVEIGTRDSHAPPAEVDVSDFGAALIGPGYLDLHIHGSAGYDVMDDAAEALPAIEGFLARHGVTSYLPTTVTAPMEKTLRALERLADAIEEAARPGTTSTRDEKTAGRAVPLGIHLEGPFISHARRGVHPPENLLAPSLEIFERLWQAARGHIRLLTIAPELDGALELIAAAAGRGVCVSLGHSNAELAEAERGISAGARHATHTFNAMRPLGHRDPGILGAVLTDSRVSADIISDGIHLDPAIVKLVAEAKGTEQTVLITDATSATGMPDGQYHLGSFDVEVKNGRVMSHGSLAGSVLTMDLAVQNLAKFTGWDLAQAVSAASRNPARVAGIENRGALKVCSAADFLVLSPEGQVMRTFVGGVECLR